MPRSVKEDSASSDANRDASMCSEAYKKSMKCIEKNYATKDESCANEFEMYKACKAEETRLRKLANNGGKKQSFFPW